MIELPPSPSQTSTGGMMILVAIALLATGLVMVASASASLSAPLIGPSLLGSTLGRQMAFAGLGVGVMLGCAWLGARLFESDLARRHLGLVVLVLATGCLTAALIPGLTDAHRGSQRWLRVGSASAGFSFQPSEFAKLAMVVFLASQLGGRGRDPRSFRKGFLPAAVGIGVCVLLVGKEDFGTAALLAVIGAVTLFVAGCRWRHLLALGTAGAATMAGLLYAEPYRLERLVAYRDFWDDPLGKGYQPIQSLTAIATGGWLGTGLGAGVQKYGYLPDDHTDFIFSVICEETGVLGGALVIALFCVLMWLGLRAMLRARTAFEGLLALGLTATVGLQAAMHITVVTVLAPTTGISLPFVSAGGSGLITFCLMIGLLSAVAARGRYGDSSSIVRVDRGWVEGTTDATQARPREFAHSARKEAALW